MSQQKRAVITSLAVLVVITVIVATAMAANRSSADESATNSGTTTQSSNNTTNTTDTASTASYADGEYTATGGYNTPGGSESLTVTVTLKDGVITDTTAKGSGGSRDSEEYQERFVSNYKSQVVGKAIDSIDLSRVSGSSLTPIGFNNAIEQIKNQAS